MTEEKSAADLIATITVFRTTDNKVFYEPTSAKDHQQDILDAEAATERLKNGESVGEILAAFGKHVPDEILFEVTANTKLVISYWQCRYTPGYQPISFNPDWTIFVYGNAGSWNGPYGGPVTPKELARYAKDSNSILSPKKPTKTKKK